MFGCGVHGEDDNLSGRADLANSLSCLNAVQLGHGDVYDCNIGAKPRHLAHGLAPVGCITDHSDVGLRC
jgi:hypothetical protein